MLEVVAGPLPLDDAERAHLFNRGSADRGELQSWRISLAAPDKRRPHSGR